MNLFGRQRDISTGRDIRGGDMPEQSKLRKWAAEAAHQAKAEKDANEARRLLNFAQYWTRLADAEEWQRDHEAA